MFLLLTMCSWCRAQSQIVGQSYVTTVRLNVTSFGSPSSTYDVSPGIKFTVIDITSDNKYVIQFGNFSGDLKEQNYKKGATKLPSCDTCQKAPAVIDTFRRTTLTSYDTTKAFIGSWANYRKFLILPKDLDAKCALYYTKKWDFSYGALTLPLKVRFGNSRNTFSSYEENLNLGLTAGAKVRLPSTKNQVINFLVLIGVASVNLDSLSVRDRSLYNSANPTAKAVSFGLGVVYQYEAFQIGLLGRMDHISGLLGRAWTQQDRPWLGIGIGLALFNNSNAKTGNSPSNDGGK